MEDYKKKYIDALERAKYWANNPTVWSSDDICQKLFPEIIEEKDEIIKACIGMCLTDACEQRFKDYDTSLKDCLAWLEKQGEKKCTANVGEMLSSYRQKLKDEDFDSMHSPFCEYNSEVYDGKSLIEKTITAGSKEAEGKLDQMPDEQLTHSQVSKKSEQDGRWKWDEDDEKFVRENILIGLGNIDGVSPELYSKIIDWIGLIKRRLS